MPRLARKAGVDHNANIGEGQRGFRDRGREHDLAPSGLGGRDGAVLRARIKAAVELDDVDVCANVLKAFGRSADLRPTGQEDEHAARLLGERAPHRVRDHFVDPRARFAWQMAGLDRVGAPLALDDLGAVQELGDPRAVERCGHDKKPQILPQPVLRVDRKREPEVRVERPLMELVEQDRRNACKLRILRDYPCEHAVGHDLDPGAGRNLRAEPDAQADGIAHFLGQRRGHPRSRRPRREPPRLEHENSAVAAPCRVEQRERNARRLPRARRRHEDRGVLSIKRREERRQDRFDRQAHADRRPVHRLIKRTANPQTILRIGRSRCCRAASRSARQTAHLERNGPMRIEAIKIGVNPPEDINVVVEVPIGGEPIKYEMDKEVGTLVVDRFLYTSMRYPGNYGFVPQTLSDDGDPIDVLVANTRAIVPGAIINCRPVGVFKMEDEGGGDEKIIAVPSPKLTRRYEKVQNYTDLPEITISQIAHFFEHYKDLEGGKWVKGLGWGDADEAKRMIVEAIERAKIKKK